MLVINQLKVHIDKDPSLLIQDIAKKLQVNVDLIKSYEIVKRSLDARKKDNLFFVYNVSVSISNEANILKKKIKNVSPYIKKEMDLSFFNKTYKNEKIAIIGFGPAGMFAALTLSKAGVPVTVFERGEQVENRMESIRAFKETRILNKESNIQFGEGGAGTYSDGKLTNRGMNEKGKWLFTELVKAGAPEEIMYVNNPHIGTDLLVGVVRNIREEIKSLGSNIFFNHKVTNIVQNSSGYTLTVNDKEETFDKVILAIGHSARDTFEMLYDNKINMEQKPFAVGFRIEHKQATINKAQYGKYHSHPRLEAAEYKLTYQTGKKAVYTFCMCPGGYVVPAASEEGMVCVNGMSEYKRDNVNANSALLVTVDHNDIGNHHPLGGMRYQRDIEKKAFELGGSNYNAPVQLVGDFVDNKKSTLFRSVKPSYEIGTTFSNLRDIYSDEINQAIIEALPKMGNKLRGFDSYDSILLGVESRSSSPIRIVRERETMESTTHSNLYPIGEGAGYAGGIVSAGVDGIKAAEKILEQLQK